MMSNERTDEITQAEKKQIIKVDTFFTRQQNTVDDAGGRAQYQ